MGITQKIIDAAASLPPEEQRQLLEVASKLREQSRAAVRPWQSLRGALAHRGIDISGEELGQTRREMWANFPRDLE